jgi:hypothetical protein
MITAVALISIGLIPAYGQSLQTGIRTPQTGTGRARKPEPFRIKKLLLKELPKDSKGFVFGRNEPGDLKDDDMSGGELAALYSHQEAGATAAILYAAVHDNDLYRFKLQANNTVAIVSKDDGRVLETFSCRHLGDSRNRSGSCSVKTYKRAIYCIADSGNGSCELAVTINGKRYPVAIY